MKKGWEKKNLGELVDAGIVQLMRGKIISKKDIAAYPGDYPVYSSAKEGDGRFGAYGHYMFDEELITWSVDGGGRLFHRPKHRFSVTNVGGVLRILQHDTLDYKYLFYALTLRHSETTFDWVKKAHPSVIKKLYVEIPVPPLAEQQRIVGVLDEAFAGLATAQAHAARNLENARALFESHLQSVFSRKGEGWVEKRLGELCQIKTGKKDVNEGNPNGKYPFFTCAAEHTYSDVYSFDAEALLVAGNGNVGQVSYYKGKFEAYQRTYVLFNFSNVYAKFLFRVLDKRLSATVGKQKLGNTMPYIKIGMLTDFSVPIPPKLEQQKLAEHLDSFANETQRLARLYEQKLAALAALKKSLLHQAFSGEL